METSTFIIVGIVGFILLLILGNRLLHTSQLSPRRFAIILSSGFALFLFFLIIATRPFDRVHLIVALFISTVNLLVGYLILFWFHTLRSGKE